MLDRLSHNYRKEWLQDKHIESCKKVNQEDLSICIEDKMIKDGYKKYKK